MDKPTRIFFSAVQAARLCGISNEEMLRLLNAGEIDAIKTDGGHWKITASSLEKWANEVSRAQALERRKAYEKRRLAEHADTPVSQNA